MIVHHASRKWRVVLATLIAAALISGGMGARVEAGQTTDRGGAAARPMLMFDGPSQIEMLPLSGLEPTWSEIQRVYHALSTAQAAATRFRDVAQAEHAGYRPASPLFSMGEGVHYVNQMYLPGAKHAINLATPPVLVYRQAGGKLTLAGVSYVMPANSTPQQLDSAFPRSMATWHLHINTCVRSGVVVRIHAQAACAAGGGQFTATGEWMVHAWLWQPGAGLFNLDGFRDSPLDRMPGMRMGGRWQAAGGSQFVMREGALQMRVLPLSGKSPTWAEISKVYGMLSRAQAATARYRDVRVAEADGYYTSKVLYVETQGFHYVNPKYMPPRASFDPATPPILVYNSVGGEMVLSGVMYYLGQRATPQQMAAVFPASMASWHQHINICFAQHDVVPIFDQAQCEAKGYSFLPTIGWMVHAWLYRPDTTGVFSMDR
jgi:hypothetical protein